MQNVSKNFKQISKENKERDQQISIDLHVQVRAIGYWSKMHQSVHAHPKLHQYLLVLFSIIMVRPEIHSFYKINYQWRHKQNVRRMYISSDQMTSNDHIKVCQKISHGHKWLHCSRIPVCNHNDYFLYYQYVLPV